MKFYADVHRSKRNDEGYRITYTTVGTAFKHVDSLGEIPAGPGDRLFMDTIPPQHTGGAIELLRRGVGVYYLRRLTLIEKMHREHRLPKSARGDIRALMKIGERWFRRVTGDFLVMRRMVLVYKPLMKTHQQLMNRYRALSEAEREVLRQVIKSLEMQMEEDPLPSSSIAPSVWLGGIVSTNNWSPGPAGIPLKLSTCLKAFPSVEYVILNPSTLLIPL